MALKYALERLYTDQDPELVSETIAPVLAWIPGRTKKRWDQPYTFRIQHESTPSSTPTLVELELTWDVSKLESQISGVNDLAQRLRRGRSALHEDVAKLAAYGLSFVAVSAIYPKLRILAFNFYAAPDLIYDLSPTALKGIEVAGRSTGGESVLSRVRHGSGAEPGKQHQLLVRADIAEAHLALWCSSPRVALMARVK